MGIPNVDCVYYQPTEQLDALSGAYRNVLSHCDSYEHHFVGFYTLGCPSEGRIGVDVTFLAVL